jgi:hypothetical protein
VISVLTARSCFVLFISSCQVNFLSSTLFSFDASNLSYALVALRTSCGHCLCFYITKLAGATGRAKSWRYQYALHCHFPANTPTPPPPPRTVGYLPCTSPRAAHHGFWVGYCAIWRRNRTPQFHLRLLRLLLHPRRRVRRPQRISAGPFGWHQP